MKLGKAYVDFPVCPPLHFAINLGTERQLPIAEFLIRNEITLDDYALPPEKYNPLNRGYPPAILYGLGFGQRPTKSHAALIQRLHLSHPDLFHLNQTIHFLEKTGNSPLLHITLMLGNFEGSLLLLKHFNTSVNVIDSLHHALTPLHIITWFGDIESLILLLHNGANVFLEDKYRRNPFHYAIIRRQLTTFSILVSYLLESPKDFEEDEPKIELLRRILFTEDKNSRDIIDYLTMKPFHLPTIGFIHQLCQEFELNLEQALITSNRRRKFELWKEALTLITSSSFSMSSPLLGVDLVPAEKNLTRLAFIRNYHSLGRPSLITQQLTLGQGIWAYVGSNNHLDFLDRYGSLPIRVNEMIYATYFHHLYCHPPYLGSRYSGASDYETECFPDYSDRPNVTTALKIEDFFLQARSQPLSILGTRDTTASGSMTSLTTMKIAQTRINYYEYKKTFYTDFQRPSIFQICDEKDHYEDYKITLSTAHSLTPLHFHNTTWNVLLQGKKIWYLLPPSILTNQSFFNDLKQQTLLTKKDLLSSLSLSFDSFYSSSSSSSASPSLFSSSRINTLAFLRKTQALVEIVQEPEDVVYIPDMWGHIVVSLEDSISLSQEFCTFRNTDMRVQPIGPVLYGGKDAYRGLGSFKRHERTSTQSKFKTKTQRSKIPSFDQSIVT